MKRTTIQTRTTFRSMLQLSSSEVWNAMGRSAYLVAQR
jgi:hypothetical protein